MDGMKVLVKAIIAAGLVFSWPGPQLRGWMESLVVDPPHVATTSSSSASPTDPAGTSLEPARWFAGVKSSCNAVEVETRLRAEPPPAGTEGSGYAAACLALAGRIDAARERITTLPSNERWMAAGIVFEAGHPAADMGDDLAAGPLMELVVEFWPNHYMALYHAGASRFQKGDPEAAQGYLTRFLEHYGADDGWRRSALAMLAEIEGAAR